MCNYLLNDVPVIVSSFYVGAHTFQSVGIAKIEQLIDYTASEK